MVMDISQGWLEMGSQVYSICLKTEAGEQDIDEQTQRRRKAIIISVVCCVVVLLLGVVVSVTWYYARSGAVDDRMDHRSSDLASDGRFRNGHIMACNGYGGSARAIQLCYSAFGRIRLFCANNKRVILLATCVTVAAVIAIVVTVVLLRLHKAGQTVPSIKGTGGVTLHPNSTPSVNIPLVVGLVITFVILSLVSIGNMLKHNSFRPENGPQVFTHFVLNTIFVSPHYLTFYRLGQFVRHRGLPNAPLYIRIPLTILVLIVSFPALLLTLFWYPLGKCLPVGVILEPFKEFLEDGIPILRGACRKFFGL